MSTLQEVVVLQEMASQENTTVAKIYFKNGDKVKQEDVIAELETSKAVFAVEAEKDGYIEYLCSEGDEVSVGAVIIKIHDNPRDIDVKKTTQGLSNLPQGKDRETVFSIAALELIKRQNLDKKIFSGMDFVGVDDINRILEGKGKGKVDASNIKLVKINRAKQLEIENLRDVQSANMNCVVGIYVDTQRLLEFANDNQAVFKSSILSVIVFEVGRLLKKYPEFNAYFADGNIAFYNEVNIGLAVDMGYGLKVMRLIGADKKSIKEIEAQIMQLLVKYVDKKLAVDDVTDTTFTISDLSTEGINFFIPLINKQQSAILGISSIDEKLHRCSLTMTFDHRVSEGKKASAFLKELKDRLESYKDFDKKVK